MAFEDVEHLGILLASVATAFGLFRGIRAWRTERQQAREARARQDVMLAEVLSEFRPRNGRTLAETVAAIDASVADHHRKADGWFADNALAHTEIHRRVDGLFELLAGRGVTQPRKIAEWHAAQRARDEREET